MNMRHPVLAAFILLHFLQQASAGSTESYATPHSWSFERANGRGCNDGEIGVEAAPLPTYLSKTDHVVTTVTLEPSEGEEPDKQDHSQQSKLVMSSNPKKRSSSTRTRRNSMLVFVTKMHYCLRRKEDVIERCQSIFMPLCIPRTLWESPREPEEVEPIVRAITGSDPVKEKSHKNARNRPAPPTMHRVRSAPAAFMRTSAPSHHHPTIASICRSLLMNPSGDYKRRSLLLLLIFFAIAKTSLRTTRTIYLGPMQWSSIL